MRQSFKLADISPKPPKNEWLKGQSGQILVYALVFLLLGSLIIPALLNLAASGLKQGAVLENRTRQNYTTDAGVENAIWWLTSADHTTDPLPATIGSYKELPLVTEASINMKRKSYVTYLGKQDGKYTYRIKTCAGPNILDNSSRDSAQPGPYVQVIADVSYTIGTRDLFGHAIAALGGDVTIDNNATITSAPDPDQGNIIANGDVVIQSNVDIYGNVSVTGDNTITVGTNSTVGSITYEATLSIETIDTSIYKIEAQAGLVALDGTPVSPSTYNNKIDQTFTIDYANTHYTGDLILGNNETLTFNGNLYVDGYISANENASLTVNGALYVANNNSSDCSIDFGNNATVRINGVLYANGDIITGNNNYLILGGTTYVDGSLIIENNNALTGDYTIVARDNIIISNNSTSYAPLLISELGYIDINNNVNICGYFYAPNGSISLSNNASITGAAVALSVDVSNNVTVTFDTTGREGLPGEGCPGGVQVITWDSTNN